MTASVRRATVDDVPAAAAALAAAFESYAWTRWSIPADRHLERLERLQTLYLTHTVHNGLVLVTDDQTGAAALLPPKSPEPAEHVQREIAELIGDRLAAVTTLELPPRPQDSWDFATLGVRPADTGRGLGSQLIREGLEHVARSGSPRVSLKRHPTATSHCTSGTDSR